MTICRYLIHSLPTQQPVGSLGNKISRVDIQYRSNNFYQIRLEGINYSILEIG
jgi:hypothetical protein